MNEVKSRTLLDSYYSIHDARTHVYKKKK